jgi:hypothetical protein
MARSLASAAGYQFKIAFEQIVDIQITNIDLLIYSTEFPHAFPQRTKSSLKVAKCEIFHLFDFNDFYVIKSLYVGYFRDKIKN